MRIKVVVGDVVQDPFLTVLFRPLSADVTCAAFLLVPLLHLTGTPQPGSSDPGISGLSRQSHGAFEWCFWRGDWTDKVWKCRRPYQKCHTWSIKLCCQGKETGEIPLSSTVWVLYVSVISVICCKLWEVTYVALVPLHTCPAFSLPLITQHPAHWVHPWNTQSDCATHLPKVLQLLPRAYRIKCKLKSSLLEWSTLPSSESSREGQGCSSPLSCCLGGFLFLGLLFAGYFVISRFIFWQERILCLKLEGVQGLGVAIWQHTKGPSRSLLSSPSCQFSQFLVEIDLFTSEPGLRAHFALCLFTTERLFSEILGALGPLATRM